MTSALSRRNGPAALALFLLLAGTPLREALEASMLGHMLGQIPLLVAAGALGAHALSPRWKAALVTCNAYGIPGITLALLASTFWMLPRALDAALDNLVMEAAKFISLPLLVGLPLALSWRPLTLIGQGLVLTNFASMLAVLGWLYLVAPVRICNNYLVSQQVVVGWCLVALACGLLLVWAAPAFFGGARPAGAAASVLPQLNREVRHTPA